MLLLYNVISHDFGIIYVHVDMCVHDLYILWIHLIFDESAAKRIELISLAVGDWKCTLRAVLIKSERETDSQTDRQIDRKGGREEEKKRGRERERKGGRERENLVLLYLFIMRSCSLHHRLQHRSQLYETQRNRFIQSIHGKVALSLASNNT